MIHADTNQALKFDAAIPISSTLADVDVAQRARRHTARRLLPFRFVWYIVAFLDRMNVGAAALQMPGDFGFSDRAPLVSTPVFSFSAMSCWKFRALWRSAMMASSIGPTGFAPGIARKPWQFFTLPCRSLRRRFAARFVMTPPARLATAIHSGKIPAVPLGLTALFYLRFPSAEPY
jgi:hypothetical protein